MNNSARLFANASKKLVATWIISAIVVLVGLTWMFKEFTVLGILPGWVGGVIAIAAVIYAVVVTFRNDEQQQPAPQPDPAPAPQPNPAPAPQPDPVPAPAPAPQYPAMSAAQELFAQPEPTRYTKKHVKNMREAMDDVCVEVADIVEQAQTYKAKTEAAEQAYNRKVARGNAVLSQNPPTPPTGTP